MQDLADHIRALSTPMWEDAYHRLLEAGPYALPALVSALEFETSRDVRCRLLAVAAAIGGDRSVVLLGAALDDPDPVVWHAALDGLVSIGGSGPHAIIERAAGARHCSMTRREYLREALDQLAAGTETTPHAGNGSRRGRTSGCTGRGAHICSLSIQGRCAAPVNLYVRRLVGETE